MEYKKDFVSIIVPIHNGEEYLERCLLSICNQTYALLEIILIDDGSTDDTVSICRKFQKKDNRVILIEHDSCEGVSKSRNDGLKRASGEYISFVDADDFIYECFIEKLIEAIKDKDISIVAYKKINCNYEDKNEINELQVVDEWKKLLFHILCTNLIGGYCFNKLYRQSILDGIIFDPLLTMGEDFIFLLKYLKKCNNFAYIPDMLYGYRINSNSVTRKTEKTKKLDAKKWDYVIAVDEIYELMKEDAGIQPYVSYRIIRGNLWYMLQLVYCNVYEKNIIAKMRNTINKHYGAYKKANYGSIFQRLAIRIMIVSPRLLFYMGRFLYYFAPMSFKKIVTV